MAFLTHPDSKFSTFALDLKGGGQITGIHHISQPTECTPKERPLIVGIHGGTCIANYFDLDKERTASLTSSALGIPFVAINKPGYCGSRDVSPTDDYQHSVAELLHEEVLPELWKRFGLPNICAGVVLLGHSLGTTVTIPTAALYGDSTAPSYPLAGIIIAGIGARLNPINPTGLPPSDLKVEDLPVRHKRDDSVKTEFMLSDPELHLFDKEILPLMPAQNVEMGREELYGGIMWQINQAEGARKKWYHRVRCPVLFALAEHDNATISTIEDTKWCAEGFLNSPRVDWCRVLNAPHAIEWSRAGKGWYTKCFGWAMEVTADFVVRQENKDNNVR